MVKKNKDWCTICWLWAAKFSKEYQNTVSPWHLWRVNKRRFYLQVLIIWINKEGMEKKGRGRIPFYDRYSFLMLVSPWNLFHPFWSCRFWAQFCKSRGLCTFPLVEEHPVVSSQRLLSSLNIYLCMPAHKSMYVQPVLLLGLVYRMWLVSGAVLQHTGIMCWMNWGEKLVIYLGEQHLMRNFAVVMTEAEE